MDHNSKRLDLTHRQSVLRQCVNLFLRWQVLAELDFARQTAAGTVG
jgi:hypothetical protein